MLRFFSCACFNILLKNIETKFQNQCCKIKCEHNFHIVSWLTAPSVDQKSSAESFLKSKLDSKQKCTKFVECGYRY